MTMRTYYPPAEPDQAEEDRPDRNDGLRWGFTLLDLHRAAQMAIARNVGVNAFSRSDRYDIAWTAAATALYESDEPVTLSDLASAAWMAISEARTTEMRHHGIDHCRHVGQQRPRFATYWDPLPGDPPVDRLCEALALTQIWPSLTAGQQEAIAALAAFGNATAAADGIGKSRAALHRLVQDARKRFKTFWFEGESVPPTWGRDTRTRGGDADPRRARRAIQKRARKARKTREEAAND